ncbi:hypothetical protein ACA758_01765 [Mycoplasmopsis agassizii]|uniref:hypothetical protein n=1 Tax=Mycoplasmopsis agassizii TaxID=33922 RepID=UPI003528C85C
MFEIFKKLINNKNYEKNQTDLNKEISLENWKINFQDGEIKSIFFNEEKVFSKIKLLATLDPKVAAHYTLEYMQDYFFMSENLKINDYQIRWSKNICEVDFKFKKEETNNLIIAKLKFEVIKNKLRLSINMNCSFTQFLVVHPIIEIEENIKEIKLDQAFFTRENFARINYDFSSDVSKAEFLKDDEQTVLVESSFANFTYLNNHLIMKPLLTGSAKEFKRHWQCKANAINENILMIELKNK